MSQSFLQLACQNSWIPSVPVSQLFLELIRIVEFLLCQVSCCLLELIRIVEFFCVSLSALVWSDWRLKRPSLLCPRERTLPGVNNLGVAKIDAFAMNIVVLLPAWLSSHELFDLLSINGKAMYLETLSGTTTARSSSSILLRPWARLIRGLSGLTIL